MTLSPSYAAFRRIIEVQGFQLEPALLPEVAGFQQEDWVAAYQAFVVSARALASSTCPTRPAITVTASFLKLAIATANLPEAVTAAAARDFFVSNFDAFRLCRQRSEIPDANGFLTGYYEPEVEGSLLQATGFVSPILARPADLVTIPPGETLPGIDPVFSSARATGAGGYEIYPSRSAIEDGALAALARPIVWLRDAVEVFLIQVQGSARVRLPDGSLIRLGYAGRNGHPYTSIGRILIEAGEISESGMSLARLKNWIRRSGQGRGQAGMELMHRNHSYVFFKVDETLSPVSGPVGAAAVPLTALRSIAVDRNIWHYGLPFWIDADLPWQGTDATPFQRLMIAQDTGSAILGPARADIFFGSGDLAGKVAGDIRHHANFHVLLPSKRWE